MKFKKLTLYGFKSFADKTEIHFGEGITGIVGPNGCGKSNVADAVRWVLGEQSAKLLRGQNMQDVIFNGTAKRKKQSYAEVSLTFDNRNRSLFPSCEYEEVVIARKLFATGESEYYRNGSLCRLRDINDMLRDAGFAIEGYTVIGQGRVQEIINSKPEDRRSIFEEAAGITKYKYKKLEAERRMSRTRDNLTRVDDLLEHDRDILAPLSRQAEKTRTYIDLRERLKHHEINLYINHYETASGTKDKLSEIIAGIEGEIAAAQKEQAQATEDYNRAVYELGNIEGDLDRYRNAITELSVDKEKISGTIKLYQQQLDSLRGQNAALMASNSALNDNYDKLSASSTQKQTELSVKNEQAKVLRAENDKLSEDYDRLAAKVIEEENKINAARAALIAAIERRAAVNRSVGELTAERAALTDQAEDFKSRIVDIDARIVETGAAAQAKDAELETIRAERESLISQKQTHESEKAAAVIKLREQAATINELQREISVLVERKRVLADVKRDAFAHAVLKLVEDAKTDPFIDRAILGVVGRVIKVKEGFEQAIDIALGNALNNIITKDEDDAHFLVDHLKKNKYGRATFLPISSYKPRSIDGAYRHLLERPGCFGVATGAIEYDPMFEPIMRGLLGGTVVVDNLGTAVKLARESKFSFRIVTLDGDVVSAQGSISGGSKKSDNANVFASERKYKEIEAEIPVKDARLKKLVSDQAELSRTTDERSLRIKELAEDIHEYEVAVAARTAEQSALQSELNALISGKTADEETLRHINEHLADITADLDAIEHTQSDDESDPHSEENVKRDLEFAALRGERDRLHERLTQKNIELVALDKDIETLKNDIDRIKSEAIATSQTIESNNMTILGNNRSMQECDDRIQHLTMSISDGNEKRYNEINAKINGLSDHKNDLNTRRAQSDELRIRLNDTIAELTERKHEQDILLAQVDVNMEVMHQRVSDEYGLNYEQCLEFKDESYDPEAGEVEVAKLRRRIASLGNINENAIEEAQELSQKVNKLSAQRDDLIKSISDEMQIIKEMSAKMMRDFDVCFKQIRANFREVFTELFRGGSADLELTDNEDPLLRGVEIKAQPPLKNLQSITLLSGGEKTLTAIAILVAIMKLRPMPFVLLDEIEAALDDANVGRVAKTLKMFSTRTQVIAITHRKPTMEESDFLYGVTMEEKGVSKIVSVRLADAIEHAESVEAEEE